MVWRREPWSLRGTRSCHVEATARGHGGHGGRGGRGSSGEGTGEGGSASAAGGGAGAATEGGGNKARPGASRSFFSVAACFHNHLVHDVALARPRRRARWPRHQRRPIVGHGPAHRPAAGRRSRSRQGHVPLPGNHSPRTFLRFSVDCAVVRRFWDVSALVTGVVF